VKQVTIHRSFKSWQNAARELLREKVHPSDVIWQEREAAQGSIFVTQAGVPHPSPSGQGAPEILVPARFLELAKHVAAHRSETKWSLLYNVLWRIVHCDRNLLHVQVDSDVNRLLLMDRELRNDAHRMQGLLRFRKILQNGTEHYVAWYRSDHYVVPMVAPFFANRFATMNWSILTPDCSVDWDCSRLRFGPGVDRSRAPADDELEELWRTYYKATYNPARTNVKLMRQEMPARHWATLPEADAIAQALIEAPDRLTRMQKAAEQAPSSISLVPPSASLDELRAAAARCDGCPLHRCATQTVFGEGPQEARVVFIGEQPGDQEDLAGRPFVGPAGEVLDRALHESGLDRSALYVTNAVKHFKFVERGKRRLHQTPRPLEVVACRPWLEAELQAIKPEIVICLGATASRSLLGATFQLMRERGRFLKTRWAPKLIATLHPSAVLRAGVDSDRQRAYELLRSDLSVVAADVERSRTL
jgi:DNA polymerase